MAAGDLIALSDIKAYIYDEEFEEDELLESFIPQASKIVKDELATDIISTDYTNEFHNGFGVPQLYLNNYPIIRINSVAVGTDDAVYVVNSDSSVSHSTAIVDDTQVTLRSFSGGWQTTELVFSDYNVMSDMFADISDSNWEYTITSTYKNYPPEYLIEQPGIDSYSGRATLEVPDQPEDSLKIRDKKNSCVYNPYVFDTGIENIFVSYRAGWETVPEPIVSATEELVKFMWELTKHDSTLTKEEVGDYAYSAGIQGNPAVKFDNLNIGTIKMKLMPYKRTLIW